MLVELQHDCITCVCLNRAYVYYLDKSHVSLLMQLTTLHNSLHANNLMQEIKKDVLNNKTQVMLNENI